MRENLGQSKQFESNRGWCVRSIARLSVSEHERDHDDENREEDEEAAIQDGRQLAPLGLRRDLRVRAEHLGAVVRGAVEDAAAAADVGGVGRGVGHVVKATEGGVTV